MELSFKYCPACGTSTEAGRQQLQRSGQKAVSSARGINHVFQGMRVNSSDWNLSGENPFSLSATISTTHDAGTIVGKAFSQGLWRSGGGAGQGKMLFLRGGVVCFDIGWVGCVTGNTRVCDGISHEVMLQFRDGSYRIYIDGVLDATGLHSVPDHPDTTVMLGAAIGHHVSNGMANGDMAPAFQGQLSNVLYSPAGQPPEEEFGFVKIPQAMPITVAAVTAETAVISAIPNCSSGDTVKNLGGLMDLAHRFGKAKQSTNYGGGMVASHAIRGSFASASGFGGCGTYSHTNAKDSSPNWEVDFPRAVTLKEVQVYNRPGYGRRLRNVNITFLGRGNHVLLKKQFPNPERCEAFRIDLGMGLAGVTRLSLSKIAPLQSGDDRTFNLNAVQCFGWDESV